MHEGVKLTGKDFCGLTQSEEGRIIEDMVNRGYILGVSSSGENEFWPPDNSDTTKYIRKAT